LLLFFRKEDPCFKSSGIGRKGGIAGMREYMEIKKTCGSRPHWISPICFFGDKMRLRKKGLLF
jgi:hypothetical protein